MHLPEYVKRWGPPAGWDSAPNESHHKTEIKGPSKNTQRNASTLIKQTCNKEGKTHFAASNNVIQQLHSSTGKQRYQGS